MRQHSESLLKSPLWRWHPGAPFSLLSWLGFYDSHAASVEHALQAPFRTVWPLPWSLLSQPGPQPSSTSKYRLSSLQFSAAGMVGGDSPMLCYFELGEETIYKILIIADVLTASSQAWSHFILTVRLLVPFFRGGNWSSEGPSSRSHI